ncbi:1-acyl-sn-glycerol-3-phosphate acyltransferase [Pyxidicoccus fallax]|uniref:1-acyl-sn-glycerol-3-phosphate acyltransferase n=1 Tax=Pyxidicoccus fallax TaxID=394095 RepID=A0A848LSW8_9BACT|nr:lysophospholipid acyltransferase family protein [Pyxidicoccus fallax]NMO20866.1 1-acyl-sn-glycerol-3-phosphate acyltransferase [Pyxidicoccus fallax]NPC82466.1 1-acyl-sn-glycerol-3-phosphate acyltransferase [Pyxidicoccus fallax]
MRAASEPSRPGLLESLLRWGKACAVAPPLLGPALMLGPMSHRVSAALTKAWSAWVLRSFGVRVEVKDHNHGRYDAPPYLFVQLNQTSLSETFLTYQALPLPVLIFMNIEYAALPFAGWIPLSQGSVVVVRQWSAQARRAVDRAVRALRRGESFYMSVEGRRSPDGTLGPYKKGAAVLAIQSGATVIPMVFRGAREVLPPGEWRMRPGDVTIELLPAISTRGMTYEDRDALIEQLRALAEAHGLGSPPRADARVHQGS